MNMTRKERHLVYEVIAIGAACTVAEKTIDEQQDDKLGEMEKRIDALELKTEHCAGETL